MIIIKWKPKLLIIMGAKIIGISLPLQLDKGRGGLTLQQLFTRLTQQELLTRLIQLELCTKLSQLELFTRLILQQDQVVCICIVMYSIRRIDAYHSFFSFFPFLIGQVGAREDSIKVVLENNQVVEVNNISKYR